MKALVDIRTCVFVVLFRRFTLSATSRFAENQWLENEFDIEIVPFCGTC